VVDLLQKNGAKFRSSSQATNFIAAASEGDIDEVKALMQFGNIDVNEGDYDRRTALHLAAGEGRLEVVELLCEAGADVNIEDRWGNRPLDDAASAKTNSAGIMQLLQKYGAESLESTLVNKKRSSMNDLKEEPVEHDIKGSKEDNEDTGMMQLPSQEFAMGCSVLHQAALGNQFEMDLILREWPALVNFHDYDRRTALHIAASEGHVDICRYLVERGAAINRSDRWGGSPLDDAHRHRHADVVDLLQKNGAKFRSSSQATNFIAAASEGDIDEVKALMQFGNIDVNEGDYDRRTALHLAAGEGRLEVVELLCEAGADVNIEDRWGNRPLDDAASAKTNSAGIMQLLQKYGAKSTLCPKTERHEAVVDNSKGVTIQHNEPPLQEAEDHMPSGTIAYCPPELFLKGSTATPASDMWAIGVIMFILLTGSHPFDRFSDKTDDDIKDTLIKLRPSNSDHLSLMDELVFDDRIEGLSDSCVALMRRLMQPDPNKRLLSEDFLRHPWIQGLTASWKTMGKAHDKLKSLWQNKFRTEIIKKYAKDGPGDGSLSENNLKEIFQALDLKKNGVLELEEIMTVFRDMGITEENIRTIFECADLDGTGVIHWEEFRALMREHINDGPGLQVRYLQQRFKSHVLNNFADKETTTISDRSNLREIFKAIDLKGNGILDPHEIRVVLRSAGEQEDVISRIIASLDLDQDGGVSWDNFIEIMNMADK